jgi:hypothetical protein
MTAKFEIISMAEIVDEQYADMQVPNNVLCKLYKGAVVPAITSGAIESTQKWGVTIVTTAEADNGDIHTHEVSWSVDEAMTFTEFLRGKKDLSVNIGSGLRIPWKGINQQWTDMVDCDLADMTAITAWATANCMATVNTKGLSQFSINQLKKKFKQLNLQARD